MNPPVPPGPTRPGAESFDTASAHATREVPLATPRTTAGELRSALAGRRFAAAGHVVVCEAPAGQGRFVGIARLEDVLAAPGDTALETLMDPAPPVVAPGTDQEIAAWRAVRHDESALAVVDEAGRFHGLIPPPRLVAVLLSEHEEDLLRLGGFLTTSAGARRSSEESVGRRFVHRLPWLLVGLGGALVAAEIVAAFEAQLAAQVLFAFFLPGVVYLADAVGTQTETIVVRGLSVGVDGRRMAPRELWTGLAMGSVIALASYPIVWGRWGDPALALAVALSLLAACSTATVVAMALPWMFSRLRIDPAFGSGPLATVIQDLLSILIYFAIVTRVVSAQK